jgi:hypothetical protein
VLERPQRIYFKKNKLDHSDERFFTEPGFPAMIGLVRMEELGNLIRTEVRIDLIELRIALRKHGCERFQSSRLNPNPSEQSASPRSR